MIREPGLQPDLPQTISVPIQPNPQPLAGQFARSVALPADRFFFHLQAKWQLNSGSQISMLVLAASNMCKWIGEYSRNYFFLSFSSLAVFFLSSFFGASSLDHFVKYSCAFSLP